MVYMWLYTAILICAVATAYVLGNTVYVEHTKHF